MVTFTNQTYGRIKLFLKKIILSYCSGQCNHEVNFNRKMELYLKFSLKILNEWYTYKAFKQMVATRLVSHCHLQLNYHNSHTQRGENHYHGNDLRYF